MKTENRRTVMFVASAVIFTYLLLLIYDMLKGSHVADAFMPIATFFIGWALRDTRETIERGGEE